jgi:hypothetical protein
VSFIEAAHVAVSERTDVLALHVSVATVRRDWSLAGAWRSWELKPNAAER